MKEESLKELRQSQRYRVDLQAWAGTSSPDRAEYPVRLVNISQSGLQMQCDYSLLQASMPNDLGRNAPQRIDITVRLTLPIQTPAAEMIIGAQLVYSRRLPKGRFLIGCVFTQLAAADAESLSVYLAQHARPC